MQESIMKRIATPVGAPARNDALFQIYKIYKKKLHSFKWSFVFALPIFLGRPMYCHAVRNSPGDCCRHQAFNK